MCVLSGAHEEGSREDVVREHVLEVWPYPTVGDDALMSPEIRFDPSEFMLRRLLQLDNEDRARRGLPAQTLAQVLDEPATDASPSGSSLEPDQTSPGEPSPG